jgi:hypothetical protein
MLIVAGQRIRTKTSQQMEAWTFTKSCEENRPDLSAFAPLYNTDKSEVTDEEVQSIASRWNRSKTAQKLYTHPSVRLCYLRSNFPYTPPGSNPSREYGEIIETLKKNPVEHIHLRSQETHTSEEILDSPMLNSRQSQRFYKAFIAHWTAVEALRFVELSNCITPEQKTLAHRQMQNIWSGKERTLRESLDVLEVYDFLYGYLLKYTFREMNEIEAWIGTHEIRFFMPFKNVCTSWGSFVKTASLHVRPPDVVEMLLDSLSSNSTSAIPDRVEYFRTRGFFDMRDDTRAINPTLEPKFGLDQLEIAVGLRLGSEQHKVSHSSSKPIDIWSHFRGEWPTKARGIVFDWESSDEVLIVRLLEFGNNNDCPGENGMYPYICGRHLHQILTESPEGEYEGL